MLIEAIRHPIRYRLLDGSQIRLAPGCPVNLPENQARTLLTKAPDRVRVAVAEKAPVEEFLVESAACKAAVYWESDLRILGPARVTHMATETTRSGQRRHWLCITYENSWRWIHEDLLRSRAAYETQWKGTRQR